VHSAKSFAICAFRCAFGSLIVCIVHSDLVCLPAFGSLISFIQVCIVCLPAYKIWIKIQRSRTSLFFILQILHSQEFPWKRKKKLHFLVGNASKGRKRFWNCCSKLVSVTLIVLERSYSNFTGTLKKRIYYIGFRNLTRARSGNNKRIGCTRCLSIKMKLGEALRPRYVPLDPMVNCNFIHFDFEYF